MFAADLIEGDFSLTIGFLFMVIEQLPLIVLNYGEVIPVMFDGFNAGLAD